MGQCDKSHIRRLLHYFCNYPLLLFVILIIASVALGLLTYWMFWVGCSPHPCEAFTFMRNDHLVCAVNMLEKNSKYPCFPGCIDNIESYLPGTHLNTTCYVYDRNFESNIWYCQLEDTVKIPLLPPICSMTLFLYISVWLLPFSIWMLILIFFCIACIKRCVPNKYFCKQQNHSIHDETKSLIN